MKLHKRASKSEYFGLLEYESLLVQEIEIHSNRLGHENEVRVLEEKRREVSVQRRRMKLALQNKKQQVVPALTAQTKTHSL